MRRTIAVSAMVLGCALALTGCFVIPLADGRSPFDDPGGPRFSDVRAQHAAVQEAVDGVLTAGDWVATVDTARDNCEGPCNLHLGVEIAPSAGAAAAALGAGAPRNRRSDIDLPVPSETLADVVRAVVPIAAGAKLDVTFDRGCVRGESVYSTAVCAALDPAAQQLVGATKDYLVDDDFLYSDGELTVRTAKRSSADILSRLG